MANRRFAVIALLVMLSGATALLGPPAGAASSAPAASADAYAAFVDVQLLPTKTPVRVGPIARAAQDHPPGAAEPSEAQALSAGPLPSGGELLTHVGVMTSVAGADGSPRAVASSVAADVALLAQGGEPLITADVVRAQANSDCTTDPNGTGTTFVNLRIGTQTFANTPAPNTVIDLQFAKVILNEQRPAFDGRGIVVNAIHVLSTTTGDALFRGDIIVAHAMSSVACPDGPGSTGGTSLVKMVKTATPDLVEPEQELTYTATVTNTGTAPCLVNRFIEHLNPAFDFVSTAGDFGTALDSTLTRPGGGTDLLLGNGKTIPAGGTFTQTFVVRAKADSADGTYYNNLEILCANLGNFVKGLDAPVQIRSATTSGSSSPPASPPSSPPPSSPPSDPGAPPVPPAPDDRVLPFTGSAVPGRLAAVVLLGAALVAVRRRVW